MDYERRAARTGELRLLLSHRAVELEAALIEALPFSRRAIRDDLALASSRLAALAAQPDPAQAPDRAIAMSDRAIAMSLPGNAILSNPLTAIAAAFLTGSQVYARLPQARQPLAEIIADLVGGPFGGHVTFVALPGPEFVDRALTAHEIRLLMVFGSEKWVLPLEDQVRRTGTTVVFEGAGTDPFVVLGEPEAAARALVRAGCYNAGQACAAPERVYVLDELYDAFAEAVAEEALALRGGDPAEPETDIGPVTPQVARSICAQIDDAIAGGAKVLLGGGLRPMRVNGEDRVSVEPTVLINVPHDCTLMSQETFGPVLPLCRVSDAAEAYSLAADSAYGLSATVFGGESGQTSSLEWNFGRVYADETWLDHRLRSPLECYGGRRLSGWVWRRENDRFVRRDGPLNTQTAFT
jgi:succinate-semialdehyde dehydrogenase/glutarate-semialdehyde dehydrogenase